MQITYEYTRLVPGLYSMPLSVMFAVKYQNQFDTSGPEICSVNAVCEWSVVWYVRSPEHCYYDSSNSLQHHYPSRGLERHKFCYSLNTPNVHYAAVQIVLSFYINHILTNEYHTTYCLLCQYSLFCHTHLWSYCTLHV